MGLKSNVIQAIQELLGREIGKLDLYSERDCPVVSFDVFDTLVVRNCSSPKVVFGLVERRYNNAHPEKHISGFLTARVEAELKARSLCGREEPTVYEIYALLDNRYADIAHELLAFELQAELDVCRVNPEAKALFDRLVATGKRIVIASDMYLPASWIALILDRCGYSGYERLFVSSELGITKRSGAMFKLICEDAGIQPSDLLHIGDHPLADFLVPKRGGVSVFLYKRKVGNMRLFKRYARFDTGKRDLLAEDVLEATIENGVLASDDVRWKMGYAVLGPMLLGYSTWLHGNLKAEKTDETWFLSREGRILKDSYEFLYGADGSTRYINVSRVALCRAMAGAATDSASLQELFSCLMSGVKTVGDYFSVLGVSPSKEYLNDAGLSADKLIDDVDGDMLFSVIRRTGAVFFDEQRALLDEYLGVSPTAKLKIAVCDIGWAGTMQALLQKAMPGADTLGLYLAVSDFHDHEKGLLSRAELDRRGYWCSSEEWSGKGQAIRFAQSATEALFLNDEDTTLGYERYEGSVVPVKGEGGKTSEVDRSPEILDAGAFAFLDDCRQSNVIAYFDEIDGESAMLPYLNSVVRPSRLALRFYSYFEFVDGVKRIEFLPLHGLLHYATHPAEALAELQLNNSKVLWLRGLLKLPLPYFEMLVFLTSKAGMKSGYSKRIQGR